MAGIDPISMGIETAGMVAQTISQINDTNKRREYDSALGRLNADQQKALNKKIATASSQNERLAILANAVAQIKAQEAAAKVSSGTMTTAILVIGGGIALVVLAYLIKKK